LRVLEGFVIAIPKDSLAVSGAADAAIPPASVPRIARICALGLALDELLGEVCRELLNIGRAESCCLILCPDGSHLGALRHIYVPSEASDPREAYREGPGWDHLVDRLLAGRMLSVPDLRRLPADDPFQQLYKSYPVRSALLLPLKFGSRLLGVLALHTFSAPAAWGGAETEALELSASILAAALERRRMESMLRASEAQYRFLAENANDFISLHDLSGRYVYASPSAFEMAGIRPEVILGCPISAFLHPDDVEEVMAENGRLTSGETRSVTLNYRMRRRDGSHFDVESVATAVSDEQGKVRQILRVTRDVSEREQMARRLFESRKMETVGMLAGGVAHEFNNLLVGINGSVEMLNLLFTGNREAATYLDMIARMGNRAVELTHQLLAYARQGKYSPEPLLLNKVVSDNIPILKTSLPPTVELMLSLADALPPVVGDIAQIRQVVMNLCLNAAEAMPGGGTLSICTRVEEGGAHPPEAGGPRVDRRSGQPVEGPRVVLEVSDNGCGMDASTLDRIFEPFFSTKFVGRGMGLAAVRGIIDSHHGEIAVASEPAVGTRFSVRLPVAQLCVLESKKDEGEAALQAEPSSDGKGIVLVADDEADVRMVVRAMLESLGYDVIEAGDGVEAVALFRERHAEIDLVLLDLMMPGMTGDRAFAEMRSVDPGVRALLASGYDESGRVGDIVAGGFGGFLQKPFRRGELGRKIVAVLGAPSSVL
jgi:PAS domain S-box-containing protein